MLLYEIKEWEQLFWNKFKAFRDRDQIGSDRVQENERLTREWGGQLLEETQSPDARSGCEKPAVGCSGRLKFNIIIDHHDDRQILVPKKPQQTMGVIHSANFLKGFKLKIPKPISLSELKEIDEDTKFCLKQGRFDQL